MKTIEQAAIEFSTLTNGIVDIDRKLGFEAGVRFAQQWISVNDKLPPETKIILYKKKVKNGAHESGDN